MEKLVDPESILQLAWSQMVTACTKRRHPFHTPSLATSSQRGPEVRSVILRHVDPENWEVRANADVRSPKVIQLLEDSRSSWLFYSFPDHLQVRCYGNTHVHRLDDVAERAWNASQLLSRRCYLAPLAPTLPLDERHPNIPSELVGREPTEQESEAGFQNFCVLRCEIVEMDILRLLYDGNLRILARKNSTPIWVAP